MPQSKIGVGFGVLVLRENKILLGKRHEDQEKASSELKGAGTWTMPGGKLHFGETFETGAKRELKEETNLDLKSCKIICINNDLIESVHFVTIGIFCDDFEGELKTMEPDEITEWKWFDFSSLPKPLYFPSKRVLDNYFNKKFYIKR